MGYVEYNNVSVLLIRVAKVWMVMGPCSIISGLNCLTYFVGESYCCLTFQATESSLV